MDDVLLVKVIESLQQASHEELCLLLTKLLSLVYVVPEISASKEVHTDVKVFSILEGKVHVDEKLIFKIG